jgi:hypothetical protein
MTQRQSLRQINNFLLWPLPMSSNNSELSAHLYNMVDCLLIMDLASITVNNMEHCSPSQSKKVSNLVQYW